MKSVKLQYFALLREQAGSPGETVETEARDPAALFEELRRRHGFTLAIGNLRVAVNGDFCGLDAPLRNGDEVVFIPPVAGG